MARRKVKDNPELERDMSNRAIINTTFREVFEP